MRYSGKNGTVQSVRWYGTVVRRRGTLYPTSVPKFGKFHNQFCTFDNQFCTFGSRLKLYLLSAGALSFSSVIMPLSSDQVTALKDPNTKIMFQDQNPKKGGSNAWGRYDKYKNGIGRFW